MGGVCKVTLYTQYKVRHIKCYSVLLYRKKVVPHKGLLCLLFVKIKLTFVLLLVYCHSLIRIYVALNI